MDARSLLLDAHALGHSGSVVDLPGKPIPDAAWDKLSESELRQSPDGHTSVAWVLWHIARCEDMGINALVRGVPELFDREGWLPRLGVEQRHVGTGMTDEEAAEFSSRVDLAALRAYWDAVGCETRSWLTTVDLDSLDKPIDNAGLRIVRSQDFIERPMAWAESFFPGKTAAWFVMRLANWHNFFHLGHAEHVINSVGFNVRAATRR